MKLEYILDNLGFLEKNSFIKVIDSVINRNPKNIKAIDKILINSDKGLKSVDSQNIVKIFSLIEKEFTEVVMAEFVDTSSQLDILVDIIIKDGNCIIKQEWFSRLYENKLKKLKGRILKMKASLENEKSELSDNRKRDYLIYRACVNTAHLNDLKNNREAKITDDELSILLTLVKELELSQEEVKLINYMVLPINRVDINTVINNLKNIGVIFYSKKSSTVYIADEVVRLLRKARKKEFADKYLRRILKLLKESQINIICRKHGIDRKLSNYGKIKEIINEGISLSSILSKSVHKEGTNLTEKKKFIIELWDKGLNLTPGLKGVTLEDKISNLILHFEGIEKDERVGISIDGYDKMLSELEGTLPKLNKQIRAEFEFQDENVLKSEFLLDYNIKPRDILDLIPRNEILAFCNAREIKTRGDEIVNILDFYKDAENLYLENYEKIGFRNLSALKENGLDLKESELGLKFEDLTKAIFVKLGFNVDEGLKKRLNTKKDKMDVLINLGNHELIIVECKTVKERGYDKFSSVSRQLKAYYNVAKLNDYKVIKSLLIAPDFSDDFVNDCELEYELNLSLMTASSLIKVLDGFKKSTKHKHFPYKLLMRDVLINEDRILKAIN